MLSLRNTAAMTRALSLPIDPILRALLITRMSQLMEYDHDDLADLACFLIVQVGDTAGEAEAALGFPILTNFVDGKRFGEAGFEPSWEWMQDHGGWFEAVYVLTDDGFGWTVLIEDRAGADPALLNLCHAYAAKAPA